MNKTQSIIHILLHIISNLSSWLLLIRTH